MKPNPKNLLVAILLVAVVALSVRLLIADRTPPPAPAVSERPKKTASRQVPEASGAVERALRLRIRQLEDELAAARAAAAAPTNAATDPAEVRPTPNPAAFRMPNPREMMENLKKNDPKRYEEFQKRFARMRQRQSERTKGRLEFLGSLDTSGMTEAERTNHERLQELLVQRENLPEFSEKMSDEEMREAGRRRWELDRAIREANAAERTTLLKQTASSLGLEGDDAAVLTETIQEVIRATDSDRGGPHGPPPPMDGAGPR